MLSPKVSVIIPAYNGKQFLADAIRSVLDQTYPNFELIIVDDASPDNTRELVNQFNDERIIFLQNENNVGAAVSRKNGVAVSTGEIIFFLDQDDMYHPDKLLSHIQYRSDHPEIGFTYNSRYQMNYSSETIREQSTPPAHITLSDLVLGFPIVPSEWVLSREWFQRENIYDDRKVCHGGETIFLGKLYLEGCKFGRVDRVLNYRRHQSGRTLSNIPEKCNAELFAQKVILSDPRCPANVVALRDRAFANTYLVWAYCAFSQKESSLGQQYLLKAGELNPSLLSEKPFELLHFLVLNSIADESLDHELLLADILSQFPEQFSALSSHLNWTVSRGYLLKGTRAVFWGREKEADSYFSKVVEYGSSLDEGYLHLVSHMLLNYELEHGNKETDKLLRKLTPYLYRIGGKMSVRQIEGNIAINRAFDDYHSGDYSNIPCYIITGFLKNPKYLINRGVWSMMFHSIRKPAPVKGG